MAQQILTFEYPLNERFRTFLRADHLVQLARYRFNNSANSWDSRDCVATIIELCNLIERTEIKSELIKELERHINNLQRLAKTPKIDHIALNKVLASLEGSSELLKGFFDKQNYYPKENDLLNSIRQRISIPGGACSFDLPAYHYWLQLSHPNRQYYLNQWLEMLKPMEKALTLMLDLTRQSNYPTQETANNGTFQKSLNSQSNYQLIQVNIPIELGVYPEISGSKHRINIRFLQANFEHAKPTLAAQEIPFTLNCCMI